jgi:Replicative DNA helicase
MEYFRLLKPLWGQKEIEREVDGQKTMVPNPDFVREIEGPNTVGDKPMTEEALAEKNAAGYNIYFFPNCPSKEVGHKYLRGSDIDVFRFVFVDMDLKDKVYASKDEFLAKLKEFPTAPSMVVDSGNGIHAYWAIDGLTRDEYVYTQFALIQHFKTDDSIWTPLQLMRYPGTLNTKDPANPKPCQVLPEHSSDKTYAIDDVVAHLPEITPDNHKRMKRHLDRLDGREEVDLGDHSVDPNELPARFVKDLASNKKVRDLFEDPKGTCGDRSKADMTLANLLFSLDYSKAEALQVLMNSKKALTRNDRQQYAFNTVDKVYKDRPKYTVGSALERRGLDASVKNLGKLMHGPEHWDCLYNKWRRKQVMGMIAGSGVGKTTATLDCFRAFIENNPESDEIYVFFSLEMTEGEIYERWDELTGAKPELAKRLYVVANEDDDGNPRNIGLQEILWYCRDIERSNGKKIGALAIDHLDAISRHIDTSKKDSLNIIGNMDRDSIFSGDMVTIGKGAICAKIKELAKKLDAFIILQSQTTKEKDGGGDIPLGKNAAFGVSNFEWYVDYIMTLWRPIKRVQDKTQLRVTAWQYAKIRRQHKLDPIQENIPSLLKFDLDTGTHESLTEGELEEANGLIRQANILRKKENKRETENYQNSPVLKKLALIYKQKGA